MAHDRKLLVDGQKNLNRSVLKTIKANLMEISHFFTKWVVGRGNYATKFCRKTENLEKLNCSILFALIAALFTI